MRKAQPLQHVLPLFFIDGNSLAFIFSLQRLGLFIVLQMSK